MVTSGAIALGRAALNLPDRGLRLEEKQAAAAVGQINLAHAYQASLARSGLATAQLLLTLDDSEQRRRYLNARSTIEALLKLAVIPVVNENDTVATNEIRFGDNDRLSARVAVMASAEELILLSDVEGLYTRDPARDPAAVRIELVPAITPEIEAMAGGAGSLAGTGGMVSKLAAAKIATRAGCNVIIAPRGRAASARPPGGGWRLHPLSGAGQPAPRAQGVDRGLARRHGGAPDRRRRGPRARAAAAACCRRA